MQELNIIEMALKATFVVISFAFSLGFIYNIIKRLSSDVKEVKEDLKQKPCQAHGERIAALEGEKGKKQ